MRLSDTTVPRFNSPAEPAGGGTLPYSLRTVNPDIWANYMSCTVISPTHHVLQPQWANHMSCSVISLGRMYCKPCPVCKLHVLYFKYCKPCPLGKLYVLPSDFFYTFYIAQNPAHWENYMSYLVISPTLYILESLPIGKILCPVSDLSYAV